MKGEKYGNNWFFEALCCEVFQHRNGGYIYRRDGVGAWRQPVLEIDTADDNNFYADNALAETETAQFVNGSATITVDGLDNDAATVILGLPAPTSFTPGDDSPVQMQGYGAGMDPPFVGFGCVRRTQMNGVVKYWPLILPKVKFGLPGDEAATQEDQIDWQTQELEATVIRDDTAAQNWKVISAEGMATESGAMQL